MYGYNGGVSHLYSIHDYLNRALHIVFTLKGNEELLGGYWFLHTLFFSSFIFYAFIKLVYKLSWKASMFLFLGLILFVWFRGHIHYLDIGKKEIFATIFMISGFYYKSCSIDLFANRHMHFIIPTCLLLLLMGSIY